MKGMKKGDIVEFFNVALSSSELSLNHHCINERKKGKIDAHGGFFSLRE